MVHVDTQTCENKPVRFTLPSDLSEVTLGQIIENAEIEKGILDLENSAEELKMFFEFGMDSNGNEYPEERFNMDYAKANEDIFIKYAEQLKIFLPEHQHKHLYEIPFGEIGILRSQLNFDQDIDSVVDLEFYFISHDICSYDIDRLSKELSNTSIIFERKKYFKTKKILKQLKEGKVIAIPAKDVLFKTRVITDKIQETLPSIPDHVKKIVEEHGSELSQEGLVALYRKLHEENTFTTLKKFQETNKQSRAISKYFKDYEEGFYKSSLKLLSHICIPLPLDYDYSHAEERAEYFRKLDMLTVKKLLNFFLFMRNSLTKDMGSSSRLQKTLLQRSLNNFLNNGDG